MRWGLSALPSSPVVVAVASAAWLGFMMAGCARVEHRSHALTQPGSGGLATLRSDAAEMTASESTGLAPEAPTGHAAASETRTTWFPDDWPLRWPGADAPPGVIRSVDSLTAELELDWLRYGRHLTVTDEDRADVAAVLQLASETNSEPGFFRVEGPGSFNIVLAPQKVEVIPEFKSGDVISHELAEKLLAGTVITLKQVDDFDPADEPNEVFRFISAMPETAPDGTEGVAIQRTWFAHYAPLDPASNQSSNQPGTQPAAQARGVVVMIPGMFGTPQNLMRSTALLFRKRGWHVVRMLVHPARMTERVELAVGNNSAEGAAAIAELLDNRAAEAAYATWTAVEYLASKHEAFGELPHAIVGFSGGALLLPTAVAYDPDRYDAAVLVAGGENALEILDTSNYSRWINALDIDWSKANVPRGRVYDEYLVASKLDPAHTASSLEGKPILFLHADGDRAVPAATGERLWRRLGRPERWRFPLGHEFLFLGALPFNLSAIADWLDEHTPDAAAGMSPPLEGAR